MRGISIRWRLTAWYSGVLALALVAFGASVYFTMRHQLLERIDNGLREEMSDVAGEVQRSTNSKEMLIWLDRRFAHHAGFDFQITTPDGERVFANPRLGDRRLPMPASAGDGRRDTYMSETVDGEGRWRIISRTIDGPDGPLTVQVARSLEEYDHEVAELLAVLFLTGPLALVIALGGGYFLARRALAPVERMTAAANQISAQQLGRRLHVDTPGDEIGRLANTLNGMLERLERSFREMQRFTADASHELRTPISVVRTEAEVALGKPVTDEQKRDLLGNILEECERLTWITDQLLTLSREDAGITRFKREPVDVAALAHNVAETMRPLADAKRQELIAHVNGEAVICGDADRLRHVVYNLLDNAIKYTPEGGRVELQVRDTGETVVVRVNDTGIGIPQEHQTHVFERFYRVDKARTRAGGGTGLGLSIVESIVTAHGGHVELTSQPGAGTSVCVVLPQSISTN